jgi:transposase-like protein
MTFVSVAEACRRLGIDAKTLHRWLADAQLSLQGHPHDGRKKGVSQEHLQVLARLHHRHLASCEEEGSAQLSYQIRTLPADLLTLPEQLAAMQAQLATLQQQVADLTRFMTQPRPALPVASIKQATSAKRPSTSASPTPAAKPPRKPTHVIPRVEYGASGRYVVICPKHGLLPLEPDTPEWFAWVAEQDSFRFVGKQGYFTAHHEWRVPKGAWRAHRHIRNHNYIQRLAPNHELTIAVLEQAAEALQAHLI